MGDTPMDATPIEIQREEWTIDTIHELFAGYLSPVELEASNVRVAIMNEVIKARRQQGQDGRGHIPGMDVAALANLEGRSVNPTLNTMLRVLMPLGMTLAVVPKQDSQSKHMESRPA